MSYMDDLLDVDSILNEIKKPPLDEESKEYTEWYEKQREIYDDWQSKLFTTCQLSVTKTVEPGPAEHIWKDESVECEFYWHKLFGQNKVKLVIYKNVMHLDHAGEETQQFYWQLIVDGKEWYRGDMYLDEDGESSEEETDEKKESLYEGDEIFEDFCDTNIGTEEDEEYIVCKIGDYFKIRLWDVRNFFKYLLKNFEDLEEDEDSDDE